MAYMSQEMKKQLAPQIKAVLKKYGMKGTISVRHYSNLIVSIKSGKLDIIGNYANVSKPEHIVNDYMDVNYYYIKDSYSGKVRDFLLELKDAMNSCPEVSNHDNSNMMTDYFDVGWYITISIGQWDKPYKLAA